MRVALSFHAPLSSLKDLSRFYQKDGNSPFQFSSLSPPPPPPPSTRFDPTRSPLESSSLGTRSRNSLSSVCANSRIIIFSPPRPSIRACRRFETIEEASWKNKLSRARLSSGLSGLSRATLCSLLPVGETKGQREARRRRERLDFNNDDDDDVPVSVADIHRSRPWIQRSWMRQQWKGGSLIVRRFTWARDSSATPGSPGCGISRGTPGGRPCSPTVEDRNPWRRLGSLESPTPVSSSRFCTPGTCSVASIWKIKQRCSLSLRYY